jgi:Ca-activated chloride channel family protein
MTYLKKNKHSISLLMAFVCAFLFVNISLAQNKSNHKKKAVKTERTFIPATTQFSPKPTAKPDSVRSKKKELTRILFVFDDSQSMLGRWQTGAKIDIAKKLLSELLDSLKHETNLELALRVYGHQKRYPPQDCDDTKLEVPFEKDNIEKIKAVLNGLTPKGTTPIARSLESAAGDFPKTKSRNLLILLTDGLEECDGDPCKVSLALQKSGVVLKPFVVGIGFKPEYLKQLECIGDYYDAGNEKTFKDVLNIVISQALNNTTAQVNLLDSAGKATETNVNMTFYDSKKGDIKYNFIHTMNSRGNPDTLLLDPLITYRIVVHTTPPVQKDSVKITAGKHTIIGIDAPQGNLVLKNDAMSDYKDLKAIVRKSGEMQTFNVQTFSQTEKYLIGKYDLEVLCLPRLYIKGVKLSQSITTTVKIPQPGICTVILNAVGFGSLYVEEAKKLTWICNLDENKTNQQYILQPGNYKMVFRTRNSKQSVYTVERSFRVDSGVSSTINLQ